MALRHTGGATERGHHRLHRIRTTPRTHSRRHRRLYAAYCGDSLKTMLAGIPFAIVVRIGLRLLNSLIQPA